jgi:hypothetical protein
LRSILMRELDEQPLHTAWRGSRCPN